VLRFTGAGVVEAPTALQIRATATGAGKIAAGAPPASRDLTLDEILANARWFAIDRVGPRADPVRKLVLSGVTAIAGWQELLPALRAMGIGQVAIHDAPVADVVGVDRWANLVERPADAAAGATAAVPLRGEVLAALPAIAAQCVAAGVSSVSLTLPFQPDKDGELAAIAAALAGPVAALRAAGVPVVVKGIPACFLVNLPDGPALARRTSNRWYVDADHQRDRALLFLPDVARFAKTDDCRHCAVVTRCDGIADGWLRGGGVDRLRPIESAT
jgi:hypothetical protein